MAMLRQTTGNMESMNYTAQMSALNNSQNLLNQLFNQQEMQANLMRPSPNPLQFPSQSNTGNQFGSESFDRPAETGFGLTGDGEDNWSRQQRQDSFDRTERESGGKRGRDSWEESRDALGSDSTSRYDKRKRQSTSLDRENTSFFGRPLERRDNRDRRNERDGRDSRDNRREESSTDRSSRWERNTDDRSSGRDNRRERSPERNSRWERNSERDRPKGQDSRREERFNGRDNMQQQLPSDMGIPSLLGQAAMGAGMGAGMGLGIGPAVASASNILSSISPNMFPAMASTMGLLGGAGVGIGTAGLQTGMGAGLQAGMGAGLQAGMGAGMWPGMGNITGSAMMDPQAMQSLPVTAYTRPNCSLEPPPADMPLQKQKEKPEGCRTVFIGSLPESINENIINEVFYVCGEITSIRISKGKGEHGRKFCHLRFQISDAVDKAVNFSGYRLYIRGENPMNIESSRIFVDYTESRDDQQELEREKRTKAREERHRAKQQAEALARAEEAQEKKIKPFSEHAASKLLHDIRTDESSFFESFETLTQWLDRGECNRKNVATFYALLNSIRSHVKRVVKEKQENEEIVERQRQEQLQRAQRVRVQCETITNVFKTACQKRCWDHFSKAQRKNITEWQKQVMEETKLSEQEAPVNRQEVGMEIDEDERSQPETSDKKAQVHTEPQKTAATTGDETDAKGKAPEHPTTLDAEEAKVRAQAAGLKALAEKNNNLMWEIEAYKNEMLLLKQKFSTVFDEKDMKISQLTVALHGLQQYLQNAVINPPQQMKLTNIEVVVTKEESQDDIETADMEIENYEKPNEESGVKATEQAAAAGALAKATSTPQQPATKVPMAEDKPATVEESKPKPRNRRGGRRVKKPAKEGVEKPVVEKTVVEKPVVKKTVMEKTVVETPVVEKPVVEKPVVKTVTEKTVTEKTVEKKKKEEANKKVDNKQKGKKEQSKKEEEQKKPKEGAVRKKAIVIEEQQEKGKAGEEVEERDNEEDVECVIMEGFTVCDEVGPEDDDDVVVAEKAHETQDKEMNDVQKDETQDETQAKTTEMSGESEPQTAAKVPLELVRLSEKEMALVGVLCSYLTACPSGATGGQVSAHVLRHVPAAAQETVDKVLTSLPMLFQERNELVGKTWKFCGFTVGQQ